MATFEAYLLDQGLVAAAELTAARQSRISADEPLTAVLRRAGLLQGIDLAEAVARYHKTALVKRGDWPDAPAHADRLTLPFLRENRVFPLAETADGLQLAMEDPGNAYAIQAVRLATGLAVVPLVAAGEEIDAAIERWSRSARDARPDQPDDTHVNHSAAAADEVEHLKDLALETPVVQLVNDILQDAVYARATDVHIEPFDGRVSLRIRVDGMLRDVQPPPIALGKAVVSRLKILSGLDIAERRLPQDGRARIKISNRNLDLRVATMPTIHGEAMAIRILENVRRTLDFDRLGFTQADRDRLQQHLAAPHGMVVVTGPTGSGKTTTLATALSLLNNNERKILTIEDPIEYELDGINQTQAKPAIGLTFAGAMRAFLRHDPDVIMVGEMRDAETAGIGVHAALTGHLVLTTLHTNTAAGAVTRLLDMGVDGYLLASSLRCIVGQRLVRLLCENCREEDHTAPDVSATMATALHDLNGAKPLVLWRAQGCERCFGTGYADRMVISEVLSVTDAIRPLVSPGHAATDIEALAVQNGMVPMWRDGLKKCLDGLTTIEEVRRVALDV